MITSFEDLPETLQDFVSKPHLGIFVAEFLKSRNKNTPGLEAQVMHYIEDCTYGTISMEEMLSQIKTLCFFSEFDIDTFFQDLLEILGEEGLEELEKYEFNSEGLPVDKALERPVIKSETSQPKESLPRDPRIVQSKLLQTLDSFNLHVDEKGIVAHEVERYLKGEILSRDLVPHLTAMLDKPLSEIKAIVNALNIDIFKPIQRQIAEEGTIDISYDNDASLQNFLVTKKGASDAIKDLAQRTKKDLTKISFLPKQLPKEVSQQEKDILLSELRTQGGTPNGTSLFSQETPKESFFLQKDSTSKTIDIMPKTKSQSYTIDPYRENIE